MEQQSTQCNAVVMGVIDDGLAFAHQRFRTAASGAVQSRVEYWWLQDGVYQPGQSAPFGRELVKVDIDKHLAVCSRDGVVDEEEFYRRVGLTDFTRGGHKSAAWRVSHGAHVMDQACGFEQDEGRDDRPIVCVQLPIRVTADTSGAHLLPYVHLAILYILSRAFDIASARGGGPLPVVINLSYGIFAGPHDGSAPIEDMFQKVTAIAAAFGVTLRLVLPAGNSYESRTHAEVDQSAFVVNSDGSRTISLDWRIPLDCRVSTFLEIWLPPLQEGGNGAPRLCVKLTTPTGKSVEINEGAGVVVLSNSAMTGLDAIYGQLEFAPPSTPGGRGHFVVSLTPTVHRDGSSAPALAPAGVWTVTLVDHGLASGDTVNLWVQRDDTLYGFRIRGRQSYLDVPDYTRFDHEGLPEQADDSLCLVRRAGTINAIATGASPIVMGGYVRSNGAPAYYSSGGPTLPAPGTASSANDGVTAVAPTEDSPVQMGILGAGSRSGSVVALNGTSVAAPRTARCIAELLAAGGNGDRAAIEALATATPWPSSRLGAGMIDFAPVVDVRRSKME